MSLRERRERHRRRPLLVRVAVALGGFAALGGGILLLVLPGPGIPLIAVGLGLLALEFRWAEAALQRARRVAPTSRRHRWLGAAGMAAAAAGAVAFVALWGVPGF